MIHRFEFDGTKIVLDTPSGSVHVVDNLVWELIGALEEARQADLAGYSHEEIKEAQEELDKLTADGLMFSASSEVPATFSDKPIVKSLCLHIAHDCNLKCTYCFAGKGHFGGDKSMMSLEVGKKAIDFLLEQSGPRKHCEVDFFGGEPLMNFEVVKELVAYGRARSAEAGKEIKFTLTTNALLLSEEIQQYLNKEEISVVLSLDGRKEVHDSMRPLTGGTGSYDYILPKIKGFVDSRGNQNYYVRGTFTGKNLDFAADVLHMADLGFKELSVEPVVAPPTEEYAISENDLPFLIEQYGELTRAFLNRKKAGQPFNFFHFNLNLFKGPCLPKRLSGCGAGHEYLAVTPDGELFPCHQFVGRDQFKLGHVDTGIVNPELMLEFRQAHVENKTACRQCWAKYLCSGGCHANAEGANGNILEPYTIGCELEKRRLECAIYIQLFEACLV